MRVYVNSSPQSSRKVDTEARLPYGRGMKVLPRWFPMPMPSVVEGQMGHSNIYIYTSWLLAACCMTRKVEKRTIITTGATVLMINLQKREANTFPQVGSSAGSGLNCSSASITKYLHETKRKKKKEGGALSWEGRKREMNQGSILRLYCSTVTSATMSQPRSTHRA